jgi:hypothetical protein
MNIPAASDLYIAIVIIACLLSCPFICEAQRGDFSRCIEQGWSPDECRKAATP